MRVLKNKAFNKWAAKEGISDGALRAAVEEMAHGLVDADLGGQVFKKRVATVGRGKSGGVRTLLVYRVGDKAFFVYGFAKNARANIKAGELDSLKKLAKELLGYSARQLKQAIGEGALIEVNGDEEINTGRGA
jgi:hypothetical protein